MAAAELGLGHSVHDDRITFPWPDHRSIAYIGVESAEHLVVLSIMRNRLEFSQIKEAARLITMWNEKRIGPAAFLEITDDAAVVLKFRSSLPIEAGVTPEQLKAFITTASETAVLAVQYFLTAFPALAYTGSEVELVREDERARAEKLPGKDSPKPDKATGFTKQHITPQDVMDADNQTPYPVTLERIRDALEHLGTPRNDLDEQRLITAFNDVICTFFIDNGPTLLVRAYWLPGMDPEKDFMRLFLVCNEWNERGIASKAFCHTDDDGLQVHVEYTTTIARGLTDAQLIHTVAVSVQSLLSAVDIISTNATGTSAVDWPE